ncbi:unnamed protein product [Cuscuta epithymum]|uniref:Peptidase S54 rhomboid domain-containing protein n=1 Tax=Cuscuta epithymum TaxID=186058 RepID=A0AAV0FX06_9ASTE|nr:unnamed protein product [Cuscuta epithymum]
MQRLVFLRGLSHQITTNVFKRGPYPSPPHHHHHFSRFNASSTLCRGLLSSPFTQNQALRNALSKTGQSYGLAGVKVGFLRSYFSRRGFSSYSNLYNHRRSWFQSLTPDGVVIGLIVSNVAVFLLWRVADTRFMLKNFTISVENFISGRVHTLVTSAFSQVDQWHLISNMIGLYFFGTSVGRMFGSGYLLKLYLSGAALGSVFFLVYHAFILPSTQAHRSGMVRSPSSIYGLGASGAVNAIMLLDIFLFPKKTLYFDFIFPVPAALLGIFLIGKDVLRILEGDTQISGSAHLGGAFAAAIAWAQIKKGGAGRLFRF